MRMDCAKTKQRTNTTTTPLTPPYSLFLQLGPGIKVTPTGHSSGEVTHPEKRVSPNTCLTAAPNRENSDTIYTKLDHELSNESNSKPILGV